MAVQALAALALLSIVGPAAGATPAPITDDYTVAAGDYFREDMFPPPDGSPWQATAISLNGTGPFDLYIVRTTDFAGAYPNGSFAPLEVRENVNETFVNFTPASRIDAFTLIIDNLDNARPSDAVPEGAIVVHLTRTPPLRANAEAQALLGVGAAICAAVLALSAVGVAVYFKRRKRPEADEDLAESAPRIEIPVEVPKPPRGSWAAADAAEREAQEGKG